MSANTLSKLLLSCAFALGALAFSPPSAAQDSQRDQVRAIEQEYARQHNGRGIPDEQLEYYLDRANAGWPMDRIRQDMAAARRSTAGDPWRPEGEWSPSAVVCSSVDNRYRECAVPFNGRAVLGQQISQAPCLEGQGWGQKQGVVWVNRGCRARFTMVADTVANTRDDRRTVVCKSRQGARVVCDTGIDGRVRLLNRFKNSDACAEGRTWGQRANQVWVSGNCRARFVAADYPRSNTNYRDRFVRDPGYAVTCSSDDSRRQRCDWDERYGAPHLQERISQSGCVQGRNWGYSEREGLWVGGGCRARFSAR